MARWQDGWARFQLLYKIIIGAGNDPLWALCTTLRTKCCLRKPYRWQTEGPLWAERPTSAPNPLTLSNHARWPEANVWSLTVPLWPQRDAQGRRCVQTPVTDIQSDKSLQENIPQISMLGPRRTEMTIRACFCVLLSAVADAIVFQSASDHVCAVVSHQRECWESLTTHFFIHVPGFN